MSTIKVACRVQIRKKKRFVKIVTSLVTVLFNMSLYLPKKNPIILSLFKIDILNFTMYVLMILTCPLKTYVIQLHNLISMNILFTERTLFFYNCKETAENK